MECGVIYIKVCPPKGHSLEWIKYCYIFDSVPKPIQQNLIHIANDINTKYSDDIIIPMDTMLHPGCTTNPDRVEEIANDMYDQFLELSDRQGFSNYVRCVYSVGDISDINAISTHRLYHKSGRGYDDVMVKVGRFLDESDDTGIFRI